MAEASTGETTPVCDRQAEIDEAIADLEAIVAGNLAYFSEPHPVDDTDENGNPYPPHRCPAGYSESEPHLGPFSSAVTPGIAFNCNDSPDGLCVPTPDGGGAGVYPVSLWTDNSVWARIGFSKMSPHAFHYELIMDNEPDEYGRCSFTARAWADFDDDVFFSTYERQGRVDKDGPVLEPLFIDKPCE